MNRISSSIQWGALFVAALSSVSCGRMDDSLPQPATVSAAAEETPHQAFLEEQLKTLFGIEKVDWKVSQREHAQLETLLPDGNKRIWTLAVIPYPAQAALFQASIEKRRGQRWRADAVALSQPLIEHLKSVFK